MWLPFPVPACSGESHDSLLRDLSRVPSFVPAAGRRPVRELPDLRHAGSVAAQYSATQRRLVGPPLAIGVLLVLVVLVFGVIGFGALAWVTHADRPAADVAPEIALPQVVVERPEVLLPDPAKVKTIPSGADDPKPPPEQPAPVPGHTDGVLGVAFSPDGKTLASASRDTTIKLWDVQTGKGRATLKGHTAGFAGGIQSGWQDPGLGKRGQTIKLWDVATGKEQATLNGNTGTVASVAFSPDGKTLASGSIDKTIKLWDVATGKELATLKGHTDVVWSVAFSPDGKTLASGSE